MIEETKIRQAVEVLRREAPGARIILFGSYARGDAREHSDLDFLVVQPRSVQRRTEAVRLREALRPLGVPVDVVVASKRTFDAWADTPGTLLHEAAREGRVYEPDA
jgi:predicted nucleotidyltransferase